MLGLAADNENRYKIFLKTIHETETVWGLKSDNGWIITESTEVENADVMPFWSHKAYAKALAVEEWAEYIPTEINVDQFINSWLKGMHNDSILVGINWNQNLIGKEMEPLELAIKLDELF